MKLAIVAVGQQIPLWAQSAVQEYAKRFPPGLALDVKAVRAAPRGSKGHEDSAVLLAAERQRIERAIGSMGRGVRTVVLDEHGARLTTQALAQRLQHWQLHARAVALVIGGADGLDADFKRGAHESLRLSDLTLPHALVRVLLVEQLYRAWSIGAGHPYHREGLASC